VVVDGWVGVDGRMDVDVTVQMKRFRKPPLSRLVQGKEGDSVAKKAFGNRTWEVGRRRG